MNGSKPKRKTLTLAFIRRENEILLGYKKRGFGSGKWNGFGGKVHPDETVLQGAIREMEEECGAVVEPEDMNKVGEVVFEFEGDPVLWDVHVFSTEKYSGEICESDEMRPQWFDLAEIPFEKMWADDKEWLPTVLKGKKIDAYYLFKDQETIIKGNLNVVQTCK